MAVRQILLYPDPLLKQLSASVSSFDAEFEAMLKDLEDTLDDAPYCVGIAAPQIGYLQRVVLIDASRSRKPIPNKGRLFLITLTSKIRKDPCWVARAASAFLTLPPM